MCRCLVPAQLDPYTATDTSTVNTLRTDQLAPGPNIMKETTQPDPKSSPETKYDPLSYKLYESSLGCVV